MKPLPLRTSSVASMLAMSASSDGAAPGSCQRRWFCVAGPGKNGMPAKWPAGRLHPARRRHRQLSQMMLQRGQQVAAIEVFDTGCG